MTSKSKPVMATINQAGLTDNETLACSGDPAYFLLTTSKGEVLIGLQHILQCLIFAEEQGLVPPHHHDWWEITDDLYQCGEPQERKDK